MAEGVGFELTELFTLAGFQDRYLKPLGHPSTKRYYHSFVRNAKRGKTGIIKEMRQTESTGIIFKKGVL